MYNQTIMQYKIIQLNLILDYLVSY